MNDTEWVERRLTQEEAEEFERLYELVQEEQQAQFDKQGMSSEPASYKSLIRSPIRYFRERYTTETDQ